MALQLVSARYSLCFSTTKKQNDLCNARLRCGASVGGRGDGGSFRRGDGGGGDGHDGDDHRWRKWLLAMGSIAACIGCSTLLAEEASASASACAFWEVKDGKWTKNVWDGKTDCFRVDSTLGHGETNETEAEQVDGNLAFHNLWKWSLSSLKDTMLPVGYPNSVTTDYTEYTLWRMGQVIASQISGVLTTQALLYAVGLGKGAIPTAAAVNWVLKDGIGYVSKIILSKYGRHFDVNPKGWRLLSDIVEDISNGLELLTPAFPHLFVPLSAVAGAGKSASGLIQAATRSCFYAGFAAERNFAEVIAKGEAQGMASKLVGMAIGIALAGRVGASGPSLVLTFAAVTAVHIVCNLKSYQALQLHTLNPYRAGLVLTHCINTNQVLSVKEVNSKEPIFAALSPVEYDKFHPLRAASDMAQKLQLGLSFGDVAAGEEAMEEYLHLYQREQYILCYQNLCYKVVLKEAATPRDMLRAALQACYMRHIQLYAHTARSAEHREVLAKVSYENMDHNFERVMQRVASAGWSTDGLVARPASNRIAVL